MLSLPPPTTAARAAKAALEKRYGAVSPAEADIIVALGGDGLMLQTLHRNLRRRTPIFGMNLGTVGFLMNQYRARGLPARIKKARHVSLTPLRMVATNGARPAPRGDRRSTRSRCCARAARPRASPSRSTRWSVDEYLARNDNVAMPSAKRMRSKQGARKYNALLEARKKAARERTAYLTAALGVLVVLVAVIGMAVQSNRAKIQGDTIIDHGNVQNGVTVGNSAKVTVDLFEDFQCPACLAFEQSVGPTIAADIAAGKIQARYHMLAFLDASSNGNNYSTRAANAAICASDIDVATFQKYHTILYGKDSNGQNNQPTEGSNGRTDIQLEDYGKQAGITGDNFTTFQQCVSTQEHKAYVQAVTDNASKRNIVQTPTVLINGKELQDTSLNGFNTAVKAAGGGAPATPSPSASASKSPSKPATTPTSSPTPTP